MKRALLIGLIATTATVAGAVPGVAAPDNDHAKNLAAKACHDERAADAAAFKAKYGPKHAMRHCIKGTTPEAEEALKNAAKECKAERAGDPEGFRTTYGANKNGENAYGKCVSTKAREDLASS